MNILFLTLSNINSINDRGIYTDLLRQFTANKHKVYVVSPRERRSNLPTEHIHDHEVSYLRVKTGNLTKTNPVVKAISMAMVEKLFVEGIGRYLNNVKFDLVLYSTPPVTFEKVIHYIKMRDGAKTYLLLKDIFPQNAVDLNMFPKNGLINKYYRSIEKNLYRISDYIGCMSPANVEYLLKHNPEIAEDVVEVCPNSIEPINLDISVKELRQLRTRYSIPLDKTVFIYGGNLGKPQSVDFIIECIKANNHNDQIYFLIAGNGTEFKKLNKFFSHSKPRNAKLIYELARSDYEQLVGACDVGLIFLDRRFTIPNFPSRILSYMQASLPVLASTDVNTDLKDVIKKGKFGCWCESNSIADFNKALQKLCDPELRKQMGSSSRLYLENNYTARHSYNIIMHHFT